MPDWNKVAGTRAENARKAMELLENTAGKGYEFTPEEGLDMLSGLQDALDSLKLAYKDRLPENPGFATAGSESATVQDVPSVAAPQGQGTTVAPAHEDPEVIAIANSRNPATTGGHTINTRSDQPLVIPMWPQVKEFVGAIPENQLPAYILHIGDRMYEDCYQMVKK